MGAALLFGLLPGVGFADYYPLNWQQHAYLPFYGGDVQVVALPNGHLIALDGWASRTPDGAAVAEYDPAADSWTSHGTLPESRFSFAAAAVGTTVYMVGGYPMSWDRRSPVDDTAVYAYDTTQGTWSHVAPMLANHGMPGAVAYGGRLYVAGGRRQYDHDRPVPWVEEYDPATNTWRALADMPGPRAPLGMAALGGWLYAVSQGDGYRLDEYDPTTNSWRERDPPPFPRYYASVTSARGRLYLLGGEDNGAALFPQVDEYDPAANMWVRQTDLPYLVLFAGAAGTNDGVYLVGGLDQKTILGRFGAATRSPPREPTVTPVPVGPPWPTITPTPTSTPTRLATRTSTAGPTLTPTRTPTPTATRTRTGTRTVSPTRTATPTPTRTRTRTPTPTRTPLPPPGPSVTGGGNVGARTSFGINVRQPVRGGQVVGSFSYRDYTRNASLVATRLTSLAATGKTAVLEGECTLAGHACTFRATLTDGGPTAADRLVVEVSGVGQLGGGLTGGNLLVRAP